jgi:hypothetical protein
MSFGGFLGMGEDYYPVPWNMLNYDTSLEGYRTNLTKEQIERAPKYSASTGWNWNRENDRRVRLLPNQTLLGRGMNRG